MDKQNNTQPARPVLHAASRSIDNSRFLVRGLLDGLTGSQNCQMWLSGAANGMLCSFLPLYAAAIHNCQLSMLLQENRGTISMFPGTDVLETGRIEAGCSGTPTELRQECCGCFPSSGEGSCRSGRNEVESFDRARYNPTQKTRGACTNVAQYTPPSFSAPTRHLPCQNLPSQRASAQNACFLPLLLCSSARSLLQFSRFLPLFYKGRQKQRQKQRKMYNETQQNKNNIVVTQTPGIKDTTCEKAHRNDCGSEFFEPGKWRLSGKDSYSYHYDYWGENGCQTQSLKNTVVMCLPPPLQNNAHDQASKQCNGMPLLLVLRKSLLVVHWCILSRAYIALVYNNIVPSHHSNCPRRLLRGAKVVTRTALSASPESEVCR